MEKAKDIKTQETYKEYMARLKKDAPNKRIITGYMTHEGYEYERNNPMDYETFLVFQDILSKLCSDKFSREITKLDLDK